MSSRHATRCPVRARPPCRRRSRPTSLYASRRQRRRRACARRSRPRRAASAHRHSTTAIQPGSLPRARNLELAGSAGARASRRCHQRSGSEARLHGRPMALAPALASEHTDPACCPVLKVPPGRMRRRDLGARTSSGCGKVTGDSRATCAAPIARDPHAPPRVGGGPGAVRDHPGLLGLAGAGRDRLRPGPRRPLRHPRRRQHRRAFPGRQRRVRGGALRYAPGGRARPLAVRGDPGDARGARSGRRRSVEEPALDRRPGSGPPSKRCWRPTSMRGPDALVQSAVRANIRASVNHLRHGSEVLEQLILKENLCVMEPCTLSRPGSWIFSTGFRRATDPPLSRRESMRRCSSLVSLILGVALILASRPGHADEVRDAVEASNRAFIAAFLRGDAAAVTSSTRRPHR